MKIRPCQVSLPCLPGRVSSTENLLRQDHLREGEALGAESRVSWISPGPVSPDTPGEDSIDELIKSSSDSGKLLAELLLIYSCFCLAEDSGNSVEILSSDTENPAPLRDWRVLIKVWCSVSTSVSVIVNGLILERDS